MPSDDQGQKVAPGTASGESSQWTILTLLQWTTDYFKRYAIESPRADAEVLLAHTIACERIDLYLRFDQPLNRDELAVFKQLIKRRIQNEPVAYIVGSKEFWSLPFRLTPDVLIPRPDTECLVETALKFLNNRPSGQPINVLELGVGSGAVIVALAHEHAVDQGATFWGVDRSPAALAVARFNARQNGVADDVRFVAADWFSALSQDQAIFDLIVSNPPYIPTVDTQHLAPDIRLFEPMGALDGGPEGLDAIRFIIDNAHAYLKSGGRLLLEIGFDQRSAVASAVSRSGRYHGVEFHNDYGGHDRVAEIWL